MRDDIRSNYFSNWNNNSYFSKYPETKKIEVQHLWDNYNVRNSPFIFVDSRYSLWNKRGEWICSDRSINHYVPYSFFIAGVFLFWIGDG